MNLNTEAAEEMDRDLCIFMEERYDEDSDEYQKNCSLTTTRVQKNNHSIQKSVIQQHVQYGEHILYK